MVWGTTVNVGDVMNKFRAFFNQFTRQGEMEPLYPRLLAEVLQLHAATSAPGFSPPLPQAVRLCARARALVCLRMRLCASLCD